MELDPAIRSYYEGGAEAERLFGGFPSGPLELARTQEILLRYFDDAPLDVLDVGGGPGVYAAWLAGLGHRVHLLDPIPLHVEQAESIRPDVTAEVGDARALNRPDRSADAVLLLGPLYHLVEERDRRQALAEAHRVLRPGGQLFAAAISRFSALLDLLLRLDRLHEPDVFRIVDHAVRTGEFGGPGREGLFTRSYFHLPRDLRREVEEAGFIGVDVLQIEGPGCWLNDFEERWQDEERRAVIMQAARMVESEPEMLAASSHLLAIGHVEDGE
jgi:ubiquinone/menaquinone biosynthesis C-methylase UbiE